jgi:hypothetical protein
MITISELMTNLKHHIFDLDICLQLKVSFEMCISCIWKISFLIWVSVHAIPLSLTVMVFQFLQFV